MKKKLLKNNNGFTLIEIMLAIFIFSIIVGTLFGSFHFVFSGTEDLNSGIHEYEMAKNCLDRMAADLSEIQIALPPLYKYPDMDDPPDQSRVVGEISFTDGAAFSKLRFLSTGHVSFGETQKEGVAEIVYYITVSDDDKVVLRRWDSLYPFDEFEENNSDPILCESVKSLRFLYYDDEGTDFESWDSESSDTKYATPRGIKIQLEIGDDSSSHSFETMVYLPVYREKKK